MYLLCSDIDFLIIFSEYVPTGKGEHIGVGGKVTNIVLKYVGK